MRIAKKKPMGRVRAAEEIVDNPVIEPTEGVEVDPEATELLFETEDVAQLLAEVTDEEVAVDVDDDTEEIVFTVGEDEYTVEPEGDEELLEASARICRGRKSVKASTRRKVAGARRKTFRRR